MKKTETTEAASTTVSHHQQQATTNKTTTTEDNKSEEAKGTHGDCVKRWKPPMEDTGGDWEDLDWNRWALGKEPVKKTWVPGDWKDNNATQPTNQPTSYALQDSRKTGRIEGVVLAGIMAAVMFVIHHILLIAR